MSVPTKSAISALPPPGAQRKKAGAVRALLADDGVAVAVPNVPEGAPSDELAALPIPVVPVLVVPIPVVLEGARAVGWMLETLTLGGVASNRMFVVGLDGEKAGAGATLAAGPALVAATAGLVAVVVEPVVLVPVELVAEVGVVPGSGIAPDTDSGGVPGGGAGGLGVVDVVVDVEVDVDCASAGLASPKNSAAPIARLPSLTAISAQRRAGGPANDRRCRGRKRDPSHRTSQGTPCKKTRRTEETVARHRGRAGRARALGAFSRQETCSLGGAADDIDEQAKLPTRSREPGVRPRRKQDSPRRHGGHGGSSSWFAA
jgi:hypothetical protein